MKGHDNNADAARFMEVCLALYKAIAATGADGLPNGHLYATVCGHLSMDAYQAVLGLLKRAKLVEEQAFVLRATHRPRAGA